MSHLLFICSKNQWRSPTAELLFKNHPIHIARSAGTSEKARVRINQKLMDWADVIFVMERKHKEILKYHFPNSIYNKQVIVLEIEDDYAFWDDGLIGILKEALAGYL